MTEKLMNFLPKYIPGIIAGTKTWTRRLKKAGEHSWCRFENYENQGIDQICRQDNSIKFQVGEVRQVAVAGEPVWYCSKCKKEAANGCKCSLVDDWRVLRIKILSIKPEENLTRITNADAIAEVGEGFKYPKQVFFSDFAECYWDKIPEELFAKEKKKIEECSILAQRLLAIGWNPLEWPIEFEVVE